MKFNGLSSNLPDLKIEEYIWDFGDGDFSTGSEVSHKFLKPGVYGVKLGISGYNDAKKARETKCIIKPVAIVSDNQTLAMYLNGIKSSVTVQPQDGVGDTNNVYSNSVNKDFTTIRANTFLLAELPSEIMTRINRDIADLSDAKLDVYKSTVTETSYSLLDKIAKIMIENRGLFIEIATHTDNIDSIDNNLQLSQNIAQSIVDYLISKGIEKQRMVARGYGESRPISSNDSEDGRMKNRRVEFIIVNDKR
jgi:outer membrane protein OmpA-like peptidoglycan-associated protein